MKNKVVSRPTEEGLTLVEVLASIVLISIISLGVINLFAFTNKAAVSNNAKLVTTHLAKATIERIKIQPQRYFELENFKQDKQAHKKNSCSPKDCQELYSFTVNNEEYNVTVWVSQNESGSNKVTEEELGLVEVIVEVKHAKKEIKSTVEGYVVDETF